MNYSEQLAGKIRQALGKYDDREKPIVHLIADLVARLDRADEARAGQIQIDFAREVWRVAMTLANNICVQESDSHLADDRNGEAIATGHCAKRISDWLLPGPDDLQGLLAEGGVTMPQPPAGGVVLDGCDYQTLFNAIAAATRIESGAIAISVNSFRESITAVQQQPADTQIRVSDQPATDDTNARQAFATYTRRTYTGDPANHQEFPAFEAGYMAAAAARGSA